ncbi:related to WD repeat protein PWP1 [Ustilago trichophora]|uniref:Related to WD repeat protein PWP1 n=1 Tax=Ustilago trichophora TaxID=86804 RepID=A0A5C3DPL6_9BASI|nr:related to WD repeat protein PWP1 [Ustilago trichophora]
MISAIQWIARGKSLPHPKKYVLDDDEMDRVSKMANVQFEDAKAQLERAQRDIARGKDPFAPNTGDDAGDDDDEEEWKDEDGDDAMDDAPAAPAGEGKEDPDDLSRYNLDEYDDDNTDGAAEATAGAFSNIRGLAVYQSNEEDPYVTVQDDAEKDDEEEREELEVYPTDNFIITAKTEDDVSQLEAHIYAANDSNLYVHHDLMLPSFPLCLEWLDYTPARSSADQNESAQTKPPGEVGNFIAVGTMDPEIEVWSMDVVDGMYPDAILGRKSETDALNAPLGTGKKKRKQSKARIANDAYHVDAVLSLSWNPIARNLLASASADCTVKLWDLSRPHTSESSTAFRSFTAHTDKVQSVAWQCKAVGGSGVNTTANPAVLLTGSYDKTIRIFDTRTPDTASATISIGSDVESVVWNGWSESSTSFLCSLESGLVQSFDIRQPSTALWTLQAHDTAATSVDISPHIPGCILTASSDRTVKLWNISSGETPASNPSAINLVLSRDLGIGKIFAAKFSPNDPLTLAAAGSAGQLQAFNSLSNAGVRKTFGDRLRKLQGDVKVDLDGTEPSRGDGIVRIEDDDDDEDDDDEMQD